MAPAAEAPVVEAATGEQPSGLRNRRPPPQKSYKGLIVAVIIIALGVTALTSYSPVMRAIYLGRMDKAQGAEAIEAANAFLEFVQNSPNHVRSAISHNRGPFDAQIHMAMQAKSYPSLVLMAERPNLPPEQLATVLTKAVELYNPERDLNERAPTDLQDWALKGENREIGIAATKLIAAINDKDDAAPLLCSIAKVKDQDPTRTAAALDGLSTILRQDNVGHVVNLMKTPVADQVMAHATLRAKIVDCVTPDHLTRCIELLSHDIPGVRALALDCMAGPHMNLPDKPENAARRQELGERITSKLAPETPAVELSAALRAARNLRLNGARDAVLKLVPIAPTLNLQDIDSKFFSETLGSRFIFSEPDSARAASEDLLKKLDTALDDPATREVAANALANVTDGTFMNLRPALDKLAKYGEDPTCYQALTKLVSKTFQRPDVLKANGDDLEKWKKFLEQDRPRYDRFTEIHKWFIENKQYQRVSDGKALLSKNKDYIAEASNQINEWREDPKFVPPLGLTKDQVSNLANDLNMLGLSVRKAWSGALE